MVRLLELAAALLREGNRSCGRDKGRGAVPRISMEPREKEAAVCVPGPSEIVFAIKLPMLVNAEAVKKGEELAWEATAKQNAYGKTKTPEETWRIDEAREAKEKEKAAGQPAPKKAKKAFDCNCD